MEVCVLCEGPRPPGERQLCDPCAVRVARLALHGAPAAVVDIWRSIGESDEALGRRKDWTTTRSRVHADLAVAYHDMGMAADALVEAALAMAAEPSCGVAQGVVLSSVLGGADLLGRLRHVVGR